jgi:hypothetical protein
MPFTINGIGTSICRGRGDVGWGGGADCDSVECLVVVFLPVLPFRAVHTFAWDGTQYRFIPIRWSWGLVLRAFLRRWAFVPLVAAIFMACLSYESWKDMDSSSFMIYAAANVTLAALAPLIWWLLAVTDRRTKSIRRVLGPHDVGSSDPATWNADLLANISDPQTLYGTSTYAEGVRAQLAADSPVKAMWAARLATVLEDRHEGERLTDEILMQPGMDEAIERVRKDPSQWAAVMASL